MNKPQITPAKEWGQWNQGHGGPRPGAFGVLPALLVVVLGIAALFCWPKAKATDYPLAQEASTVNATLSVSTNGTNSLVFDEKSIYHTFWVVNGLTNNSVGPTNTVYLGRSLDNVNWVEWSTNSFTNANFAEVSLTGKWSWFRARVGGATTNVNVAVTYLGGR